MDELVDNMCIKFSGDNVYSNRKRYIAQFGYVNFINRLEEDDEYRE